MIAWFIWKVTSVVSPLSSLHLPRQGRVLGLLDIRVKFHTLFIKRCIQLFKIRVSLHGHMACTMFCIVTNRQPANHTCFAKRIAVHLPVFPRDVLLEPRDHGIVRTRITKQFSHPFPIPPEDSFCDEDHGDQPHNCIECCVEQLGPLSLGRTTCCIGTNYTWLRPYTSEAIMHSFATIGGVNMLSAAEHFRTHK